MSSAVSATPPVNRTLLANLAAAAAAVSAGASVVATRYAVGETDPVSLAFYRYAVAAPCLAPFLWTHAPGHRIPARDMVAMLLLGGLFFGLFPWAFSAALQHTSAARGSIGLATIPIVTLLLARAFGRETLTPLKAFSVVLAFAGVAVAIGDGLGTASGSGQFLLGDGLMMCAVVCGATYSALAGPYLKVHGPMFVTALGMVAGVALLAPLSALSGGLSEIPRFSTGGWLSVLFLGTVGGALQFALYTWALKWIAPSRTAIYLTLNPISAMLLAVWLLDEGLTAALLAGFVLVASGIVLANREAPARTK